MEGSSDCSLLFRLCSASLTDKCFSNCVTQRAIVSLWPDPPFHQGVPAHTFLADADGSLSLLNWPPDQCGAWLSAGVSQPALFQTRLMTGQLKSETQFFVRRGYKSDSCEKDGKKNLKGSECGSVAITYLICDSCV